MNKFVASVLLALLLATAATAGDLIAQTTRHLVRLDLLAHRVCGRTKTDLGAWPSTDDAGCVAVASMAGVDAASLGEDRKAQGAVAAAPFGASGQKLAAMMLVADADPSLPPVRALEVVTIGFSGKVVHHPSCRRLLGRATPRKAAAGARVAMSGTTSEDPNQMLVASIGAEALTVEIFKYCSGVAPTVRTHTFADAVVALVFSGGGVGEAQDLWVLTTATLTRITAPFASGSTPSSGAGPSGRVELPLPPAVARPQDLGYTLPNALAVDPLTAAERTAGDHAQSVVVGLFAQRHRDAPVALRCRVAIADPGPSGLASCRAVEEEDAVLARAFAQRTAPFAVSLAAAESTREIIGTGASVGAATNPKRFAVAVGLSTRRGFGVRYFGGSASWQRGNGASEGGPLRASRPVLASASVAVKGQETFAEEYAARVAAAATTGGIGDGPVPIDTSATDALRYETTPGDPRLAIAGMSGAGHEVVSCVQQESGALQVEHHGDAVDGGWTPFSAFSQCSVQCKTGVKCRTRSCSSPAAVYGGAACPGIDRECDVCQVFTFTWVVGAPSGNCLAADGAPVCGSGTRNRAVTCERCGERVADSMCPAHTRPSDTEPCSDYYYVRGYGECVKTPGTCGKGLRYEGSCRRCDNQIVALDFCAGSPPLENPIIPCDGELETMKPFGWLMGPWSRSDTDCLDEWGSSTACDATRTRTVRCAMCDGRAAHSDYGGSDACIPYDYCKVPGHTNFESLAPLFPSSYEHCDSAAMHKEFPRNGDAVGSGKAETTPFSSQLCPCGAYSRGYSPGDGAGHQGHPHWWHYARCHGHARSCMRGDNHGMTFVSGVYTAKWSDSWDKRPNDMVKAQKYSWDKRDEDFYDMGDGHEKFKGFAFLRYTTTTDERQACSGFLYQGKDNGWGTFNCVKAQKTRWPIERGKVWLVRGETDADRYGKCQSNEFLKKYWDVSSKQYFKMFAVWQTRRWSPGNDGTLSCYDT